MSDLRIAQIGCFGHWQSTLAEWVDMPAVCPAGLAPALEDEDMQAPRQHPFFNEETPIFPSAEALLEEARPDITVISTRLDRIAPLSMQALKAGSHVVCEKPVAIEIRDLEELEQTVVESGKRLLAMLNMRNEAVFDLARQVYQQGRVGKVILANGRKSYKWGGKRPEFFGRRDQYGGTIGWVGIHAFDMIQYITDCRFTCVTAMQGNLAHPERPECEDHCAVLAEMDNGAHATISVDYLRPMSAEGHGDDWVRIVGERGIIEASGRLNRCTVISENGTEEIRPDSKPTMYRDFLEVLRTGEALPMQTPDIPFHLTRACLLAREGADQGKFFSMDGR